MTRADPDGRPARPLSLVPALAIFLATAFAGPLAADQGTIAPTPPTAGPTIQAEWEALLTGLLQPRIDSPSVVTVYGTAEVEAPADRARISFAVETEGATALEAGAANAVLMTRVSDALRSAGAGVEGFRLQTAGYSLSPRYGAVGPNRSAEIVGYQARNTVQVQLDDLHRTGALLDAALAAGANRISGLQFEIRDPEPYRHQAVAEAVRRARAEALVVAEALGMRLGTPIEVEGGADIPFPRGMALSVERSMDAMEFPTPVDPGTQTISARVTVRFRMEPAP